MKQMLEEKFDVEKVEIYRKPSMLSIFRRVIKKELRLIRTVLSSSFKDPITLFKWIFSPKTVDRGIRPQARYYEIHPENPNGIAILASHGFGSTPEIFREIGVLLAEQGYYFRTIRLSGHGTTPAHMAITSGEHWFASVVWHYQQIPEKYNRVFYLGHSLGGTLGLLLSTIYPIETIITLNTPVNLHIPSARFVRQLSAFIKYWPRSRRKKRMIKDAGLSSYLVQPLYAVAGIFEVGKVLRKRNDRLKLPVLYVRSLNDHKTLIDQPEEFRKFFPDTPTEFRDLENSPHSSLMGPERDKLHQWIIDWFNAKR